jgi:polyribonucleotide nucleotidyltransferase
MAVENVTVEIGTGRSITIETGKLARLAGGAVTIQQGETIVLIAACSDKPRPGLDFFPLQVDYREKFSAAGRFPGGFFKREGRPSEKEILTCRMTDRPIRPLFPKGFIDDVQIQALLLSADGENEADVLTMLGASAALMVSDIQFNGPIGVVRVGRTTGEFIANPTHSEMADSDLDLVYAGIADKTIMIEGAADELSEEDLRAALEFANEIVKQQIDAQNDLASRAAKPKREPALKLVPAEITTAVNEFCAGRIREPCLIPAKDERYKALDALRDEMVEAIQDRFEGEPEDTQGFLKQAFTELTCTTIRRLLLDENKRSDGRAADEVRPIECEVGLLPRTHGSSLFARGETQGLVITTLGSAKDSQGSDAITGGESEKKLPAALQLSTL